MDLRTILVHLDWSKQCSARIKLAAALARAHGSQLVGLIPTGRQDVSGPSSAIASMFKEHLGASAPPSFDILKVDDASPDALIRCARTSDLVVVGQADSNSADSEETGYLSEQLALHADRPILIVPCKWTFPGAGKNLLLAWNGTRESAMALRELEPLLTRASSVALVSPHKGSRAPGVGALLVPRTIAWMERRGIRADAVGHLESANLADALASCATRSDVDLVVIAGYGQSRLREMHLGGVTQQILTRMKVPLMLAS